MILIRSTKSGYIAEVDIDGKIFRSEFCDVVAAAEWARELKTANAKEKMQIEGSVKNEEGNSDNSGNSDSDSDCGKQA